MSESVRVSEKKSEPVKVENTRAARNFNCVQPRNSFFNRILFLQRTIGNQAAIRLIRSKVQRANLSTGETDDIYEQETAGIQQFPNAAFDREEIPKQGQIYQFSQAKALLAFQNTIPDISRSTNQIARQDGLEDAGPSDTGPSDAGLPGGVSAPAPLPQETAPALAPATTSKVCARDLQGILGFIGNHAYIESPPYRYAIISPLCPASSWDNVVTGTTAQKWDNSPDPCGKTPTCIPCNPAPGVTDVDSCLRNAFASYNNPSLYKGLGPNSNTFAGTLARTCCAGMVPKPGALGNVPGWNDAPAPARAGASPCPPGPSCR